MSQKSPKGTEGGRFVFAKLAKINLCWSHLQKAEQPPPLARRGVSGLCEGRGGGGGGVGAPGLPGPRQLLGRPRREGKPSRLSLASGVAAHAGAPAPHLARTASPPRPRCAPRPRGRLRWRGRRAGSTGCLRAPRGRRGCPRASVTTAPGQAGARPRPSGKVSSDPRTGPGAGGQRPGCKRVWRPGLGRARRRRGGGGQGRARAPGLIWKAGGPESAGRPVGTLRANAGQGWETKGRRAAPAPELRSGAGRARVSALAGPRGRSPVPGGAAGGSGSAGAPRA